MKIFGPRNKHSGELVQHQCRDTLSVGPEQEYLKVSEFLIAIICHLTRLSISLSRCLSLHSSAARASIIHNPVYISVAELQMNE